MQTNYFEIGGIKFWALGDRVIVREDEFRTGFECSGCSGARQVRCPDCTDGTKPNGKKCSNCGTQSAPGVAVGTVQLDPGWILCPDCGGKGGLIIAPDTAQRRPTSGTIVSAGPGK